VATHARPIRGSSWWRLGALLGFLGVATIVVLTFGLPPGARLQEMVTDTGPVGLAGFILGYALLTLGPVPKPAMSATAGLFFGWIGGASIVWAASLLGALGGFWLSRWLGRGAVKRVTGARVARLDDLLARRGVVAVIGSRLMPVLPFTAINYAAGLSGVRFRDTVGTAVGIVPGTLAYVAVGAVGSRPQWWPFTVSAAALVAATVAWTAWTRRRRPARLREA
jgi:uncharacterized membrane protein YdjX (TVP38/TMEM64 family)